MLGKWWNYINIRFFIIQVWFSFAFYFFQAFVCFYFFVGFFPHVDHFLTEFVTVLFLPLYVLILWLWGLWDLSSPTRDRTLSPCIGPQTTGLPGKSLTGFLHVIHSSQVTHMPWLCGFHTLGLPSLGVFRWIMQHIANREKKAGIQTFFQGFNFYSLFLIPLV